MLRSSCSNWPASLSTSDLILKEDLLGFLIVVCICPSSQHNVVEKRRGKWHKKHIQSHSSDCFLFQLTTASNTPLIVLPLRIFVGRMACVDICHWIDNEWHSNYGVGFSDAGKLWYRLISNLIYFVELLWFSFRFLVGAGIMLRVDCEYILYR